MAADLRKMRDEDPDAAKVIEVAKGLEGLRRQDGIHAAAVVITKEPLTDVPPDPAQAGGRAGPEDAPIVTQYEMHGVEDLGLLKMDFLGLRNLDVISDTVEIITDTRGVDLDIDAIPLDDPPTYELLLPRRGHRHLPAGGRADARAHARAGAHELRGRRAPSSPCTAPGRWRRTCTTTTPTARTAESRSSTSIPTPRRSSATPTA